MTPISNSSPAGADAPVVHEEKGLCSTSVGYAKAMVGRTEETARAECTDAKYGALAQDDACVLRPLYMHLWHSQTYVSPFKVATMAINVTIMGVATARVVKLCVVHRHL